MAFPAISASEAANRLGLSKPTICRWCSEGRIRSRRERVGSVEVWMVCKQAVTRMALRVERGESIRGGKRR